MTDEERNKIIERAMRHLDWAINQCTVTDGVRSWLLQTKDLLREALAKPKQEKPDCGAPQGGQPQESDAVRGPSPNDAEDECVLWSRDNNGIYKKCPQVYALLAEVERWEADKKRQAARIAELEKLAADYKADVLTLQAAQTSKQMSATTVQMRECANMQLSRHVRALESCNGKLDKENNELKARIAELEERER